MKRTLEFDQCDMEEELVYIKLCVKRYCTNRDDKATALRVLHNLEKKLLGYQLP